ncbi:MAG: antibiotic biosynthesis monooxygenase family protein [Imperialibacter sp.]|uniref:putative quinol monooxygenase n=1 Tax=Imperialibacter sp. TaxID=2038411 RepID=UPI0032EB9800
MIIRIVRMTFHPDKVSEFLTIFNNSKSKIRHFEGCQHLELWQSTEMPNAFTTYSHWQTAADLENYRHSELFRTTWAKTRVLFAEKPMAFSNQIITIAD